MRITPRHLVLANGLTVVACLLHVLMHTLDIAVGEWHDYGVYSLVAVSFLTTLSYARKQASAEPLAA